MRFWILHKQYIAIKLLLLSILTFIALTDLSAQGTVRGKITDENGEPMIGARVMLKSNNLNGAAADLDGVFSLTLQDTTEQTLVISSMGYKTIEELVSVKKGEILIRDFSLQPASLEITEIVVTAKAVRTNDPYLDNVKRKSATTLDYISSETMKKTGDASVVNAIARVPGVSTNGQFITVRGIGDRYVKTCINGSRIPTLDPFTNNIKLDLFPTSLIDNVLITKTTNPDLPGDWAGAYISVETKDYPEKLSVNIETTVGYNTNSTFRSVLSSNRSSTDWLGFDNGFRDHDHSTYVDPVVAPSQYQQFIALGLGDYFKSLGMTKELFPGTAPGDAMYKLGLTELGLLPKALFNDPAALAYAKSGYDNGDYYNRAFNTLNEGASKSGQSFANNWNTTRRFCIPNFTQNFSIGNQVKLFKQPLGFLVAFRYGSNTLYDPVSSLNRQDAWRDSNGEPMINTTSLTKQQFTRENFGWSALINLSYKYHPNHSLSLLFMPNLTGVNNVRDAVDEADESFTRLNKGQFYEQRRQLIYQLKSEHFIPKAKMKIEAFASYTMGKSSAPDFKNLIYYRDKNTLEYQIGGGAGGEIQRFYRYLTDNLFDSRLSAELPLGNKPGFIRKIKFGAAFQFNNRKSDQHVYDLLLHADHTAITNNDLDQFFSLQNFEISTGVYQGKEFRKMNAYYEESGDPANFTFGNSRIIAGFAMVDYAIIPALRASGGLRLEHANIFTDVPEYHRLGYPANDIRRVSGSLLANPGKLNELNYIPNLNLIYLISRDEKTPINLRFNYSYSVARPSIRELSETLVFDNELRALVFGNSQLKTVKIHNLDFRLESYFNSKHNVALSFFYKNFRNHIELVNYEFYTWQNVKKSGVLGIELDGKVTLLKGLELRANAAYIYSSSTFVEYTVGNGFNNPIPVDTIKRTMFGQAPYVVNAILTYQYEKIGLTTTLSYNVQGPRLVISGISTGGRPDVFERTRHLLDLKVSKTIGKYFAMSLTARNLINSPIKRTFKFDGNWLLDYDRFTYGTDIILGISFKL